VQHFLDHLFFEEHSNGYLVRPLGHLVIQSDHLNLS